MNLSINIQDLQEADQLKQLLKGPKIETVSDDADIHIKIEQWVLPLFKESKKGFIITNFNKARPQQAFYSLEITPKHIDLKHADGQNQRKSTYAIPSQTLTVNGQQVPIANDHPFFKAIKHISKDLSQQRARLLRHQ